MKKKEKKEKTKIVQHVKKHLDRRVEITLGVLLVVVAIAAILVIVKLPYTAKEQYTELQDYNVQIQEIVADLDNPIEQRICEKIPASVRIEKDPFSPYMRPFGLNDYRCYAKFRVWNLGKTSEKWTYRYIFNISGKIIPSSEKTIEIPKTASVLFEFETDECQEGDTIKGDYELVSSPMTEKCEYKTIYLNKTVTRTEIRQKEVSKERFITKYEPLWQKLLGYNNHEKV